MSICWSDAVCNRSSRLLGKWVIDPQYLPGPQCQLKSIFGAGLFENVHQVDLHRAGSYLQLVSNFTIFEAAADQFDDLPFPRGNANVWLAGPIGLGEEMIRLIDPNVAGGDGP